MNNYTYVVNNRGEVILVKKDTYSDYVNTAKEKEREYDELVVDGVWSPKKKEES